jgi:hypothetical protein
MFKRLKFRGGEMLGLGICIGVLLAYLAEAIDNRKK